MGESLIPWHLLLNNYVKLCGSVNYYGPQPPPPSLAMKTTAASGEHFVHNLIIQNEVTIQLSIV